jgi:hypothetical protein
VKCKWCGGAGGQPDPLEQMGMGPLITGPCPLELLGFRLLTTGYLLPTLQPPGLTISSDLQRLPAHHSAYTILCSCLFLCWACLSVGTPSGFPSNSSNFPHAVRSIFLYHPAQ